MKQKLLALLLAFSTMAMYSFASEDLMKEVNKIDVKDACNVQKRGIEKVLETAQKYNPLGVKMGLEFMRHKVTTSEYIDAVKKALKEHKKEVSFQKGEDQKQVFSVEFAAERACKFAVRALQQVKEAEESYRYAIPGDKFTY